MKLEALLRQLTEALSQIENSVVYEKLQILRQEISDARGVFVGNKQYDEGWNCCASQVIRDIDRILNGE